MTERDRDVSHYVVFFAGTDAADTLYEKQIEIDFADLSFTVLCFSARKDPETWYVGIYEGNTIRPIEEQYRAKVLRSVRATIRQCGLSAKTLSPIDVPLVTALSKEAFTQLCRETARSRGTSTRKPAAGVRNDDADFSIFDARSNFKRWQFAALLIGLFGFLAFVYGEQFVWADFFLLNGTFIRARTSATLFFAWGVPLTLFNAFFTVKRRSLFTLIILGFAPFGIRQLSLIRNYSLIAMILCAVFVVAISVLAFLYHRRRRERRPVLSCIEAVRNAGATAVYVMFFVFILIDLFIPAISAREVTAYASEADPETGVRYVTDEDLALLNSDQWTRLSALEQSRVLLAIVTEMSDEMGIPTPTLYLEVDTTNNEVGYYAAGDNSIHVWKPYLEHCSAAEAANVVLHELYHAFQHSILDSPVINWDAPELQTNSYFSRIWKWKQESEMYVGSDRWDAGFDEYHEQSLEEDARDFARTYVPRFVDLKTE